MVMDPVILRDLRQDYQSGRLIIFAGAGISAGGGLPNWEKLAGKLRDRVAEMGAAGAVLNEINGYLQAKQLIDAISAAKDALGGEFELMVRSLLDDKGLPVPPLARAIAGLKEHLRAVITTNLDRFLERAFEAEWPDLTDPPGDLGQDRHYILKMHGTLRDTRTWVFTRAQYDQKMFRSEQLQDYFKGVYNSHRLLFVGFGLADDNIELTLGRVRALSQGQPPTHYALLPEWEVGPSRRAKLSASGIRLLTYSAHDEAPKVLQSLAEGAAAPVAPSPAPVLPLVQPAPSPAAAPPPAAELPLVQPTPPAVAPAPADGPVDTFICYAPGDADLVKRLETHLTMIRREKLIAPWSSGQVGAGEEFGAEARERLARARLILLLVSIDFLASDEHDEQVAFAMEQHRRRAARVVPILLRRCDWENTGRFKELQVLPRNKVPVKQWKDEDEAFTQIAKELRDVVKRLRSC